MITGTIKNKIDQIWKNMWAGGIVNPISVIGQLTYLMFIRQLDQNELKIEQKESLLGKPQIHIFPSSEKGQAMRWSKFKDKNADVMFNIIKNYVFPAIQHMKNGRLPDFDEHDEIEEILGSSSKSDNSETAFSQFMNDATFEFKSPQLLQLTVSALEDLYTNDIEKAHKDEGIDLQGDIYEYMLNKLATSGQNGQFRTPQHIRDMMVELVQPTPRDIICDPACGTAGFLISAAEYIRKHYSDTMTNDDWKRYSGSMFTGFDTDNNMLRISAMNLMLHSITHPHIEYRDSISKDNTIKDTFTLCLANPPFTGTVNTGNISEDLQMGQDAKKTQILFLALFLRMLKKGGRAACVVPNGILANNTPRAYRLMREELVENHQLQAVITLPAGVFSPYSKVSTGILIFTKTGAGGTDKVWFYNIKADGFSLDDKRQPVEENDIKDVIYRFQHLIDEEHRSRKNQSFFVPKEELRKNDYSFSFKKYSEFEYTPVDYPPTEEILGNLQSLTKELSLGLTELEKML